MLDNRKMVLYSYPTFGDIAGQGCKLPDKQMVQSGERASENRQPRIGGINMRRMQSLGLGLVFMALVALLCSANAARGQDVTATITGTVTDPSGAPIVGASVIAKETDRGTIWTAQTNEAGLYILVRVPIGAYELKAEMKGFKTAVHPPFTLDLNQTARVDFKMAVGQVTESIEVSSEAPLLQADSAAV